MFNHTQKNDMIMEKKAYISPSFEVVNICAEASILTGSNTVDNIGGGDFDTEISGGSNGSRANRRRGWANEW